MEKVNELCIMKDNCLNEEHYKEQINSAIWLLLSTRHILTMRAELGIDEQCIIEYEQDDKSLGCARPVWLTPRQEEYVLDMGEDCDE